MVINHNISALNTCNKLQANENTTTNSLEKLSSGLRINKAADDAAGLAISQKMQAQINGLDTASDNSQNGISLIQTAEGALGESQSILQRMNELAVQASNGVNGSDDVRKINDEITQLQGSLSEISEQTTYNSKEIFSDKAGDGLFNSNGITLQIGAAARDTMTIQLAGVTGISADDLGVGKVVPGTGVKEAGKFTLAGASAAGGAINFELNDGNGVDETVTYNAAPGAADADVAKGVAQLLQKDNAVTDSYNVTYNDGDNFFTITARANSAVKLTGTQTGAVINTNSVFAAGTQTNGVNDVFEKDTIKIGNAHSAGDILFQFDDHAGVFVMFNVPGFTGSEDSTAVANACYNAILGKTSVTNKYVVNNDGMGNLTFTARNAVGPVTIDFSEGDGGNETYTDESMRTIGVAGSSASVDYAFTGSGSTGGDIDFEFTDSANGLDKHFYYDAKANATAADIAKGIGDAMKLDSDITNLYTVNTDSSDHVIITSKNHGMDNFTTAQKSVGVIGKATYTQTEAGKNDNGIDFSTTKTARAAIETIKSAISTVSSLRSQLGAYQNKLTHTINNLSTQSENLASASSQITDVDMAKEMTSYTKNNILVQSAQAMLAQANQLPQGVLSLLK